MAEKKENNKAKKQKSTKIKKVAKVFDYDKMKTYPLVEALELVKKFAKAKFDESVEVHFRLGIDPRKGEQQVRGAVAMPHGIGKTIKIAAFVSPANEQAAREAGADLVGGDELIAEIKKSEKTDFDVAIAEPIMMKNLAQIAKILGTRGLMPSPKNETVSANPVLAITQLKKGKVSFKNDDTANIHVAIGKVSFDSAKLTDNFQALLTVVKKIKPLGVKGVYLKGAGITSTMGPGIKVQL